MGLVGCMLAPMATQRSIDYLDTRDFAMRPRRWLELMTNTRATISFSPPFGYELCARRIRPEDVASYDLSAWRIAGIGAEPIRAELPDRFAKLLAPAGFDPGAFVPCYGMAESSLAISFSPLKHGVVVDWIDADHLAEHLRVIPAGEATGRVNGFVRCGGPLPGHEVAIRDDQGRPLPDLHVGRIKVRGPSVMSGYFAEPEQTRQALSPDGWLDTGDIGYLVDGSIVVTGRHKDMIIINGRNIWPQDIEHIAERQPELRSMDASAFFVLGEDDEEVAVVVVQCNINDAGGKPAAHAAAAPGDPRGARHLVPDRARAAAHAAAHVFRQAVARRGARGLPAASRAGAQGRAGRRRQGVVRRAREPAGDGGLVAAVSVPRAAAGRDLAPPSDRQPVDPVARASRRSSRSRGRPDSSAARCCRA